MSEGHIVVIGAGQAGVMAAEGTAQRPATPARSRCWATSPMAPYHRPPLSKGWLAGDIDAEAQLVMRAPDLLAQARTSLLRTGTRQCHRH